MIITRLVSGLGNQLFQYAIGRHLSIKHNVPLKLDIGFFETQTLRSFVLDSFHIKAQVASKEEIDKVLYWAKGSAWIAKIYRKVPNANLIKGYRYYKEHEWWQYDPNVLNASSKVYLDGYWQHHKYYMNMFPEIFDELRVRMPSTDEGLFKKAIVENASSVSIHIRRGDYVTDNLMGTLPIEYYTKAIVCMNEKISKASYYIFSDDLNWAKENLKLNNSATFIDLQGNSKNDVMELDLMSKCSHNIIANSSFSWWGAFLNKNPKKIVISPAKWVIRPEVNARIHLQFPAWIKI